MATIMKHGLPKARKEEEIRKSNDQTDNSSHNRVRILKHVKTRGCSFESETCRLMGTHWNLKHVNPCHAE